MKNLLLLIVFGIGFGFALKFFAFELFTVPTDSMEPTIKTGSKVWLNKIKFSNYKRGDIIGFTHGNENFVKRITGLPGEVCQDLKEIPFKLVDSIQSMTNSEVNNILKAIEKGQKYRIETETKHWTAYPPLSWAPNVIPKKGDTIDLLFHDFDFYQPLIENCEHISAGKILNKIYINNKEANSYVFKQNYYFVEGDNKAVSIDSRTFGLISENQIIGKVLGK